MSDKIRIERTIIAAQPGFYCLERGEDVAGGAIVIQIPIVAWSVGTNGTVVPITLDPLANVRYVLSPLGPVIDQFGSVDWEVVTDWLTSKDRAQPLLFEEAIRLCSKVVTVVDVVTSIGSMNIGICTTVTTYTT